MKKILNFRSRLSLILMVCVFLLINMLKTALDRMMKHLEGVIVVSDEDHKRIQARIDALKAKELKPTKSTRLRQNRNAKHVTLMVTVLV